MFLGKATHRWVALFAFSLIFICSTRGQTTVNSITALKALNVGTYQSATVTGYYSSGDGGGGEFVWNGTSVAPTNYGTIFKGRKTKGELATGRWVRTIPSGASYTVKWFGARGDNLTDDTARIASAFKTLPAAGTLDIPSGTYVVSTLSLAHTNVTMRGVGTLRAKNYIAEFVGLAGTKLTIEGVKFDGNNRAAAVLTIAPGATDCVITNAAFANAYVDNTLDPGGTGSAKLLQVKRGTRRITIANSQFTNVTYAAAASRVAGGVWFNDYGWASAADNIQTIKVTGCVFNGISPGADGGCVRISTGKNYDVGATISSNRFLNFGKRAIKILGNGVTAADNYVETYDTHAYSGFSAYGKRCVFERNTILGELYKGIEFGVGGAASGGRASSNNIAFGPLRSGVATGVEICYDANGVIADGNGVSNAGYHTRVFGKVSNIVIANAKGTNIATTGVHVLNDASLAPNNCAIVNTMITGAPKYSVRVDSGTNVNVSGVGGTAQWGVLYYAPAVNQAAGPVRMAKSGNHILALSESEMTITAPATITLPSAASAGVGKVYCLKAANGVTATIARTGADRIAGITANDSVAPMESVLFVSDGMGNWEKIALEPSMNAG
jgi:hypothetical protein